MPLVSPHPHVHSFGVSTNQLKHCCLSLLVFAGARASTLQQFRKLMALSKPDLKAKAKSIGAGVSGTKAAIAARIIQW